jgi:hypothetical protein
MRFLRTLRLDGADAQAFPAAAEANEWAVSGAFIFSDREPAMLVGRDLQAFRTGFLGTRSFGWSGHTEVVEIAEAEYEAVVEALARHLLDHFDAPDHAAARAFASEECRFVQSLCEPPAGTLLAVERSFGPQGIVERFKAIDRTSSHRAE